MDVVNVSRRGCRLGGCRLGTNNFVPELQHAFTSCQCILLPRILHLTCLPHVPQSLLFRLCPALPYGQIAVVIFGLIGLTVAGLTIVTLTEATDRLLDKLVPNERFV